MTRKKKAARKPAPFKLGPWVIAYCAVERDGTRAVVFERNRWNLMARNGWELTGYSRWLLRAAAWVEGGRR